MYRPALPGDVPRGYAFSSITSLICTHFDPIKLAFWSEKSFFNWTNKPNTPADGTPFRIVRKNWHTSGHSASQGQEKVPFHMIIRTVAALTENVFLFRNCGNEISSKAIWVEKCKE